MKKLINNIFTIIKSLKNRLLYVGYLRYIIGAVIVFSLIIYILGFLSKGETSIIKREYNKKDLKELKENRKLNLHKNNPPVIYKMVDYSLGKKAKWYPKGESPILKDLVKQGKLPKVHERVGPEPIVFKGCDGIGKYGGTWIRVANSPNDVFGVANNRMSYLSLLRWSPEGYPVVPHIAKSYSVSKDNRIYTITLRNGMKWSDGQPFSADDIMYWWEGEIQDDTLRYGIPGFMKIRDKIGKIEKLGKYKIRFVFPYPNGHFLFTLAGSACRSMLNAPKHYRIRFHPSFGDQKLIEKLMKIKKSRNKRSLYGAMGSVRNPEHPRLSPWIYRSYKVNPPQTFVRNPYYYMVDTEGNQLPYVDRVLYEVKDAKMINITAANGELTMQGRHITFNDYTHIMNQRKSGDYNVYHWYFADRSVFVINMNLNRRIDSNDPSTKKKHDLINNKSFRQAMSLAINRQKIINTVYGGMGEPAQCMPDEQSFFYDEYALKAFTQYNTNKANQLLDSIGLTNYDYEGYRTFNDGSRMTFFLDVCNFTGEGPSQLLINDWMHMKIRVLLQMRNRKLFAVERSALSHDMDAWIGNNEYIPLIYPRFVIPFDFAIGYRTWYQKGGFYGLPEADTNNAGTIAVPKDHDLYKTISLYEKAKMKSNPFEQRKIFKKALRIAAENVWSINISKPPPQIIVVKNGFKNVPKTAVYTWEFQSPGNTGIETYYFEKPYNSKGTIKRMKTEILEPITAPDTIKSIEKQKKFGVIIAYIIRILIYGSIILGLLLLSIRRPYIAKRLIIMIPTLLIISVIAFTVIQLPPGDFITSKIIQLELKGEEADMQAINDLKETFYMDESMFVRYIRWIGLPWFITYKSKDKGLLQGNMGTSMQSLRPVNELIGDRLLLTVLISLGTILLTWFIAIPVGIYSAVRQYSIGDYVLSFIGFIGMCIPAFLLALLLIYLSDVWLHIKVSGLFSSQYGAQLEWTWGKFLDLLKHIWLPILVLGVGGTARMIRVMRGNLLDELKKPYVTTGRAKGVRPIKLLLKYPVRIALNPFISNIGHLFPMLISGSAIVAIVLSLPTVGPLMLDGLMNEDMYLAGSMLMLFSLLGIFGTLFSDVMLLLLDPRIRYEGGTR